MFAKIVIHIESNTMEVHVIYWGSGDPFQLCTSEDTYSIIYEDHCIYVLYCMDRRRA